MRGCRGVGCLCLCVWDAGLRDENSNMWRGLASANNCDKEAHFMHGMPSTYREFVWSGLVAIRQSGSHFLLF